MIRRSHGLAFLVVAYTALWLTFPGRAGAQESGRLHLLLIGSTADPKIGDSVKVDLANVAGLFERNVPLAQLVVRTVAGSDATTGGVMAALKSVTRGFERGKDVLVVYISSHGGYDKGQKDHITGLGDSGFIYRSRLRQAALDAKGRVTVILTDSCSTHVVGTKALASAPAATSLPFEVAPAFKALFFESQGLVDVSASMPGEEARCDNSVGGYFTNAFCGALGQNAHSRVRWTQVIDMINRRVERIFSAAQQTAYAVTALPDGPATNAPRVRFGIAADRTSRSAPYDGVEVTRVLDGTPAETVRNLSDGRAYSLSAGKHVITHINGEAVRDSDELTSAVQRSPATMRFSVVGLQTGRKDEYEVELSSHNAYRFGVTALASRRGRRFGGVEVTEVIPGYPGTRIRNARTGREFTLVPGVDFITEVNGERIAGYAELRDAVRRSPSTMKVKVYDSYHDSRDEYSVDLYD